MQVTKVPGFVLIEADNIHEVTNEMIEDIAMMNKGVNIIVDYKEESQLILKGDIAKRTAKDVCAAIKNLKDITKG